jgi:hypothetical protein
MNDYGNGFCLLHRRLFEEQWFKDLKAKGFGVIHLIARARWREVTLKNGRRLMRGQCVLGRQEFAAATGLSEQEVRSLLNTLRKVEFATIESTNDGTIVTLNNYEYYQDIKNFIGDGATSNQPAKQPGINQEPTSDQPLYKESNTNKEGKEYKYSSDFERLWAAYPKKDGKKEALRHFKATVKTDDDLIAVEKAVARYLEHLRQSNTALQYTKNGSTFFNNWRDWLPNATETASAAPKRRLVSATATYGAKND